VWSLNDYRAFWKKEREQRREIAHIVWHGMLALNPHTPHPDSKRTKKAKARARNRRAIRRMNESNNQ